MSRLAMLVRLAAVLAVCLLIPACKTKVTKANYDKITDGMSLEEVEKILGKGTKETGDGTNVAAQFGVHVESAPKGKGDTYTWESGTKSITITFVNDKVTHKTSSGL